MKSFLNNVVEDVFFSMLLSREVLLGMSNPRYGFPGIYDFVRLRKDVSHIRNELKGNFTTVEILKRSHGAGAQYKEVLLYSLIRKYKPKLAVETGVGQGVSTYFILKAMSENGFGSLISVDLPNRDRKGRVNVDGRIEGTYLPKGLTSGWLVPKRLRRNWKLVLGSSRSVLPSLRCTPDFFFHDSEHSYETMMFEYKWALGRMKKGIIASDDIKWSGAWDEFTEKNEDRIVRLPFPIIGVASVKSAASRKPA